MKILGLALVVVGGLVIGYVGLVPAAPDPSAGPPADGVAPPVVGGIMVVVGLILLAVGGRRVN